jgi:tRNA(fMet)-specific endonuclease VapC
MILLDTDILSLLFAAHPRVVDRYNRETDIVATTLITRIEMLEGRFASLLKAEDGAKFRQAEQRLQQTEYNLTTLPIIQGDSQIVAEFDRLLQHKKFKKIRRADMLIASVALGRKARLVTRNLRDFRLIPGLKLENWAD